MHKINETFEKSYLLIGLSKFSQTFPASAWRTFAVRFLKSSYIHPICINAWGSFSFKNVLFLLWTCENGIVICYQTHNRINHSDPKIQKILAILLFKKNHDKRLADRRHFHMTMIQVLLERLEDSIDLLFKKKQIWVSVNTVNSA